MKWKKAKKGTLLTLFGAIFVGMSFISEIKGVGTTMIFILGLIMIGLGIYRKSKEKDTLKKI